MATDHGVSINVCISAEKVGASPAMGSPSSRSLEQPLEQARLQRGHAHALAIDGIKAANCVPDGKKPAEDVEPLEMTPALSGKP